jgi:hypothetical protein
MLPPIFGVFNKSPFAKETEQDDNVGVLTVELCCCWSFVVVVELEERVDKPLGRRVRRFPFCNKCTFESKNV